MASKFNKVREKPMPKASNVAKIIYSSIAIVVIVLTVGIGLDLITIKDRDIAEWCEEYQPTYTYEQCESMSSR